MNMNKRRLVMIVSLLACLAACAIPASTGPGMTVTFRNVIKGKEILVRNAFSSSGARFPGPGGLSPQTDPLHGGATRDAAPDGRALPEWVEFEWIEPIYQYEYTREQLQSMPVKKARILVRDRIPQDVVDEVMESKRLREPHKLPDKSLEVYFIWYESGIKFRWELRKGCCDVLRAGGDALGE
jgi:hypothetical protein